MTNSVEPNQHFRCLTTRWKVGLVWKCDCSCGACCYVKEDALLKGIVHNRGNTKAHKPIKTSGQKHKPAPRKIGKAKIQLDSIMEKRELTERDVCRLTGLSPATVHEIRKGSMPRMNTVLKLAYGLGLELSDLIDEI